MADPGLATLVAESAIRRLICAYCDAVGRLDAEGAGRLFAADATVRIADFPELVGREAITEGMRQTFALSSLLHMQCEIGLIDVTGETGRARLPVFELSRRPEQDFLSVILGTYEDDYVLREEGWRFARRRYTMRSRAMVPIAKIQLMPPFTPMFPIAP